MLIGATIGIGPAAAATVPVGDLPDYPALEALTNPQGGPSVVEFSIDAGQYRGPRGERITIAFSATYTCILSVDNPHWSTGAERQWNSHPAGGVLPRKRIGGGVSADAADHDSIGSVGIHLCAVGDVRRIGV
jgi:hypothetical protein